MQDIFEQHDAYKGDLDTSNPYTLPDPVELYQAEQESLAKTGESLAGGVVAGTAGLPGFAEQVGRGVVKAALPAQQNVIQTLGAFANSIGLENVGEVINTLYGSEQNRTAMDALVEGLTEETVLPTYEDVKAYLEEKGVSFDNPGAELLGELLSPAGYIKYGNKVMTSVKDAVKKGMDRTKKSSNSNVITKTFKDRHSKEDVTSNIYIKNSILSNETGKPMTFYHGTMKEFDEFNMSKSNYPVIYFGNKEDVAKQYTKEKGSRKTGTIKTVNLKMNKPFVVTDFDFTSGLGEEMGLIYNKIMNKIKNTNNRTSRSNQWMVDPETVKKLQNKGYDGIIIPEEASPRREAYYMVFDPSQIIMKGQ